MPHAPKMAFESRGGKWYEELSQPKVWNLQPRQRKSERGNGIPRREQDGRCL